MGSEKSKVLKKILVGIAFAGLLVSPALLKPDGSGSGSAEKFGFSLEDVAKEAGIVFMHQSPFLDKKIEHILPQIASMGASVSVCDFNKDGWNDLYFTNSRINSKNALYVNNQDGTFLDVADNLGVGNVNQPGTGVSMGGIWGDFDNDGFSDLFIYKWGRPMLFKNLEGNGFQDVTNQSGLPEWINSNTAIWLDFDNDGLLDLFVGGYYNESIDLWNLASTRFMPESFEYSNNGGRNYLMKNLGNGSFSDVTIDYGLASTKWTLAAGAADINEDGYVELIIANDYSIDEFYINAGGKKFVEIGKEVGIGFTPKSGMNVSFGDVDNNGELGLYITNITEEGVLLQGNNFWRLQDSNEGIVYKNVAGRKGIELGGWSYGAQFGDLNNDGYQDLYVANGFISGIEGTSYWYEYSKVSGGNNAIISDANNWPSMDGKSQSGYQQNMVWVNNGKGSFENASKVVCAPMTRDSRSVALADLWNRGVLDVIVANENARPLIYKNERKQNNHWIGFELTGVSSNPDAIGARVELFWDNQNQAQIVTAGIGFCGQNQHRIHFGIGKSISVDRVEITWPSGKKEVLEAPQIDTLLKVVEGNNVI